MTVSTSWVLLYKWVPVKLTPLMLKRGVQNFWEKSYKTTRTWIDIKDISPVMVHAVMASEDGRFMEHGGFDLKELQKMSKEHKTKGRKIRGCSTISQQVAKNCFTFCGHSMWRKAFEAYYTVLIEIFWGKERIMEVYLNIACVLPNPLQRNPKTASQQNQRKYNLVYHRTLQTAYPF